MSIRARVLIVAIGVVVGLLISATAAAWFFAGIVMFGDSK